jgi:hypothetical protein
MHRAYCLFIVQGGTKKINARGNSLTVESHITVAPPCIGNVQSYIYVKLSS